MKVPTILAERPPQVLHIERVGSTGHSKKKRGPKPKLLVEFLEALEQEWVDSSSFPEGFALQMRRHGDSCNHLRRAIIGSGDKTDRTTIHTWVAGAKAPGTIESLSVMRLCNFSIKSAVS